jgi:Protein of unknown function (DUF2970)
MSILKELKMVLWGFVGLGDRNRVDPPTGRPLVLVAIAFALLGLLLGTLAILAKLAASWS